MRRDVSTIRQIADIVDPSDIDLGGRTSPEGAVTLLFTDIEGSTEMVEQLGDEAWLDVLRAHNAIVRGIVARHDGIEVKSQGDGFMLAFTSSRAGLRCAIGIQRELHAHAQTNEGPAVSVRVGVHSGFAIADGPDFFGRNVILAARVADRARGGEILVSEQLKRYAEGDPAFSFLARQELALKGLRDRVVVYAVDWGAPPRR